MLLGTHERESAGLLDELRQALDRAFGFAAGYEIPQPADDVARPERFRGGPLNGFRYALVWTSSRMSSNRLPLR